MVRYKTIKTTSIQFVHYIQTRYSSAVLCDVSLFFGNNEVRAVLSHIGSSVFGSECNSSLNITAKMSL